MDEDKTKIWGIYFALLLCFIICSSYVMPLYLQILRSVRSGIKYKSESCIALRLCALAQEFDFEEDIITK